MQRSWGRAGLGRGRQGCLAERPLLEKSLRLARCLEGLPALRRQESERSHELGVRCMEEGGQRGRSCKERGTPILRTKQPGQGSLTVPPLHILSQRPQGLREGPVLLGEPRRSISLGLGGLAWRGALLSEGMVGEGPSSLRQPDGDPNSKACDPKHLSPRSQFFLCPISPHPVPSPSVWPFPCPTSALNADEDVVRLSSGWGLAGHRHWFSRTGS